MPKPIKLQEQHRSMFPPDKPINEESGRKITAWASGTGASAAPTRTAGMTDDEIGALVATLDVKTLAELKTAFEAAWPKTKGDTSARQKLQSNYDTMKAAIQAGTI